MAKRKSELPWTDSEIVQHYNQAANPYLIIGILAELNDVSREHILAILKRAGIDPPAKRTKKKKLFRRNYFILVAEDGTRYTSGQLAKKTNHAKSYIWGLAHASTEVTIDGEVYKVVNAAKEDIKNGWNYKVGAGNKEPGEAVED